MSIIDIFHTPLLFATFICHVSRGVKERRRTVGNKRQQNMKVREGGEHDHDRAF